MLKYDLITLRTSLENSILLERVPYSCVFTNATTGLSLVVILLKQNQKSYVHKSQSWNLPAIIGNITLGCLQHSCEWRYLSMVSWLWRSKVDLVWCEKWHSSRGAASLLLLCYVTCASFWHKGSDICKRQRFPPLPGLQPHLVFPVLIFTEELHKICRLDF